MSRETIVQQLRRNTVAFISLFVALSSLGYNTWRNETTERQRNLRHAAFTMVEQLGEFQSRANQLGYGEDPTGEVWTAGWGNAFTIRTLGQLLPEPVPATADELFAVWQRNARDLQSEDPAALKRADAALHGQIDTTREAVLEVLRRLD